MPQVGQTVIESQDEWLIQCHGPCQWHGIPKRPTSKGHKWSFNGDMVRPTFHPSMNEASNPAGPDQNPDVPFRRCHFIVTNGHITYCDDCTHDVRGTHPLKPWDETKVAYYESIKTEGGW
jgi:hypothetical protein